MPTLSGSRAAEPGPNQVVFTGDLPLRSRLHALSFMNDAMAMHRLLTGLLTDPASGLISYVLTARPLANRYRTESVWESQVHLRRFAAHPLHADIMRRHAPHLGAARFDVRPAR